jgi:hypothetical protein
MANKTYYLHVWRDSENRVIFTETSKADFITFMAGDQQEVRRKLVTGKYMNINFMVRSDVSFDEAAKIGGQFARGKYKVISVDLNDLSFSEREGTDRTTPDY